MPSPQAVHPSLAAPANSSIFRAAGHHRSNISRRAAGFSLCLTLDGRLPIGSSCHLDLANVSLGRNYIVGIDHYLAQFHQRFFGEAPDRRFVHVYRKGAGYVGREPISAMGQDRDLYTSEVDEWMQGIETRAAWAMRDLAQGYRLRDEQRQEQLLDYVAMTVTRNPVRLRHWERYLDEVSLEHSEFTEEWLEQITSEAMSATIRDAFFPKVRLALDRLEWQTARYGSGCPLVLGDNPVLFNAAGENWEPKATSFVMMPITPRLVLMGYKSESLFRKIVEYAERVNAISLDQADQYVFSATRIDVEFEEIKEAAATLRALVEQDRSER
jgi:hypothetical protein